MRFGKDNLPLNCSRHLLSGGGTAAAETVASSREGNVHDDILSLNALNFSNSLQWREEQIAEGKSPNISLMTEEEKNVWN